MNKTRRKAIAEEIKNIKSVVQDILSEEEDAFYNMPEGLQASENGMVSEEAQYNLSSAIDSLEDAIMYLEDIV